MAVTGVRSTYGARRNLTGPLPLPPLPNPLYSPFWFLATCPMELWDKERHTYANELDYRNVNGGETRVQFIPITKEGGFLLEEIHALTVTEQNPPLRPAVEPDLVNFLCQITSSAKGPLFSGPVPLENIAMVNSGGPGAIYPVFFDAGDMLTISVTSLWAAGGVTLQRLFLTLAGATFV